MVRQELVAYIQDSINRGLSPELITPSLLQKGWEQQDILDSYVQIRNSTSQQPPQHKKTIWSLAITTPEEAVKAIRDAANFSVTVGVLFIILSCILFVTGTPNWWDTIIDSIGYISISFWLRKSRNRTAALTFLIAIILSFIITVINKITQYGGANIFLAIIGLFTAIKAVKATFFIHKGEALSKKLIFTTGFFSFIACCLITLNIWPAVFMSPIMQLMLYSKEKHPTLYEFPQERTISIKNYKPSHPATISHFGVTLTTPWGEPTKNMKWGLSDWAYFYKPAHGVLLSPANSAKIISVKTLFPDSDPHTKELKRIIGEDISSSNYLLHMTLLNLDPNSLNITTSPRKIVAMGFELPFKEVLILGSPYVYSFHYNSLKGYQIAAKGKNDTSQVLTLFDTKDNVYSIAITNNPTQEEVDYIISTIKLEPPTTPIP